MPFLQEYTMLDELGKGGFATVYKVRHNELGYIRAIRVLNETVVDANVSIAHDSKQISADMADITNQLLGFVQ